MSAVRLLLSTAVVLSASGCGAGTANADGGGDATCTVTLTGAITATLGCTANATFGRTIAGVSDFDIAFDITAPADTRFTLGFRVDGKLTSGTRTATSPGVLMAITTATTDELLWSQSTEDPAHGAVTLNLTSASLGSDGYTFTVHGTADATLTASPATPGATGTVTAHVVF